MQDSARFISEAKAGGAAVRTMGNEARYAGQQFHFLGGRGFWLNQIFFTIRRVAYGLTLGLIGLSAAALKMGFDFNSAMQQNRIAFSHFLPNAQAVNKELRWLYRFAAYTPLQFRDVTFAERQFLAFGFSLKDSHRYLTALTDAIAAHGLGADALLRVVMAFSRVQAYGKLTGRTLYQLAANNIPVYDILTKKLHLTRSALANVARLNIPASVALPAIAKGLEEKYGGAARQQALGTMWGIWSTFKDLMAQAVGSMELPIFLRVQHALSGINDALGKVSDTAQKTHGNMHAVLTELDKQIGHGVNLALVWQRIGGVLHPLAQILGTIVADFLWAFHTLGLGTKAALPLGFALRQIYWVLKLLQPILAPLIALWLLERTALLLVTMATKGKVLWDAIEWAWSVRRLRVMYLLEIWTLRNAYATDIWTATQKRASLWTGRFSTALTFTRLQFIKLAEVMGLSELAALGWIGAAIAVVGILVILYIKWRAFHDIVNKVANFMWTHWYILAMIPVVGPFLSVISLIVRNFDTLIGWARDLIRWFKEAWFWVSGGDTHPKFNPRAPKGTKANPGSLWDQISTGANPANWFGGLQHGGMLSRAGYAVVGEAGPELVRLPAGAAVTPMRDAHKFNFASGIGRGGVLNIRVPLFLDKRQIAEANAQAHLDELANVRGRE